MADPLMESASAIADSNGTATAVLQPLRAFEHWLVERITVQSSSSTLVPTAKVYRGDIANNRLIDGTFTGTFDHSDTNLKLMNAERLIVQWTGADTNSSCTVTIEGERSRA